MLQYRFAALLMFVPALAALVVGGCAKEPTEKPAGEEKKTVKKEVKEKTELDNKGWGHIKGKVTFDGAAPERRDLTEEMKKIKEEHCFAGDTKGQEWKIGSDGGVANVVVWLRAPADKYFKIPDKKEWKDEVKIDQPYCAFIPHVSVVYPSYFDGKTKKQKETGQTFVIQNSAPIAHNTNWSGTVNTGANLQLGKETSQKLVVTPTKEENVAGGEDLLTFKCNIHPWMRAYAWVFDHPFAAVTSGDLKDDKEFGAYEIKNVPAGVEIELVYWHESMTKPMVEKITVKEGETLEKNFKIKK